MQGSVRAPLDRMPHVGEERRPRELESDTEYETGADDVREDADQSPPSAERDDQAPELLDPLVGAERCADPIRELGKVVPAYAAARLAQLVAHPEPIEQALRHNSALFGGIEVVAD